MACLASNATAQDDVEEGFQNLQVLPADISRAQLNLVMVSNLAGLGLPRRQNEGCLFCHVGNMEQAVATWDFASDDKTEKRKARMMMSLVTDINGRLADLEDRVAPSLEVTCYTCHAGRTDPRPLPDLMRAAYAERGIDGTVAQYRALSSRYFGGDAYDFRIGVLAGFADEIAGGGAFDDALAISALNEEVYPDDPQARRATVSLVIRSALAEEGVVGALTEFDRARATEDPSVVTVGVLDGLGWGLFRSERQDEALQVFRKNLAEFPDQYVPNESLADALRLTGDPEAAILMFEAWLEQNPDHAMARRRLTNLRGGGL
jgi:tetratricopeptide (TPR) repeat protein